jgi:mannose-6-phosphate isomerase
VDVPELLRILRFEVLADPVLRPRDIAPGLATWPAPIDDFALHRAAPAGTEIVLPGHGPRIVACLRGQVGVDDGSGAVELTGGQAAFGVAGHVATVRGAGQVYQATTV